MAIPDEDVRAVRAATDIAALIGEHTGLKRVGRRYVGLCPFHAESTPSFSVNTEEGLYYCFGCQVSGDAITFVRAIEGLGFSDAVERLGARAGVSVRNDEASDQSGRSLRRRELLEVVEAAVAFYHARLLTAPDARHARHYLRGRGYDGEVVRRFRLGYAPAGYSELVRSLRRDPRLVVEAGLAFASRDRGDPIDAFRDRVIFPIFDPGGQAIALGGRVLPEDLRAGRDGPGPKYRNSPESPIYSKRRTLYGLNWAKAEITRAGEAVVCEGYTDVIGCHHAGVPRAVATCGTALTEEHVRLLSNFAKRIVLAFDADRAGQSAAARLYDWERRHGVELAVARLPEGSDPGELASSDPGALAAAISGAPRHLAFLVDRAIAGVVRASPEDRTRAAEEALAAIAEHPDELVRDEYLISVADRARLDPERLRKRLEALRAGPAGPAGSTGRASSAGRAHPGSPTGPTGRAHPGSPTGPTGRARPGGPTGPGAATGAATGSGDPHRSPPTRRALGSHGPRSGLEALALAIHRPAALASSLEAPMFADPLQRAAFEALASARELHEAIARAEPEVSDLLSRLAVEEPPEPGDLDGTLAALVRHAVEHELRAVQAESRQATDDSAADRASRESAFAKQQLEVMHAAMTNGVPSRAASEARGRLVAWLKERTGGSL